MKLSMLIVGTELKLMQGLVMFVIFVHTRVVWFGHSIYIRRTCSIWNSSLPYHTKIDIDHIFKYIDEIYSCNTNPV